MNNPLIDALIDPRIVELFSDDPEKLRDAVKRYVRLTAMIVHPDRNPQFAHGKNNNIIRDVLAATSFLTDAELTNDQLMDYARALLDNPLQRMIQVKLVKQHQAETEQMRKQLDHLTDQLQRQKAAINIARNDLQLELISKRQELTNEVERIRAKAAQSSSVLLAVLNGHTLSKSVFKEPSSRIVPVTAVRGKIFGGILKYQTWLKPGQPRKRLSNVPYGQRRDFRSLSTHLYRVGPSGDLFVRNVISEYRKEDKVHYQEAYAIFDKACEEFTMGGLGLAVRRWTNRGVLIGSVSDIGALSIDIISQEYGPVVVDSPRLSAFIAEWVIPSVSLGKRTKCNRLVCVKPNINSSGRVVDYALYCFPHKGVYQPFKS